MKKNLILSLCMLLGLASCQKETQKTTNVNSPALGARHLSLAPTYTDLTLNSDGSYTGVWNGCWIKVTNPAWDQVKYPTLVDGVPVLAGSITTYDGISSIDVSNSGPDGNMFQVVYATVSLVTFNADGFDSDLASFFDAFNSWSSGGEIGSAPDAFTYIKDSYTTTVGSNNVSTYTGKLIRVTTGSNLAIADMSYPLPTATNPTNSLTAALRDSAYNETYTLHGSHNVITSATIGSTTYAASGSYIVEGDADIVATGTIIRSDGTKFNFTITYYA